MLHHYRYFWSPPSAFDYRTAITSVLKIPQTNGEFKSKYILMMTFLIFAGPSTRFRFEVGFVLRVGVEPMGNPSV